MKAHNTLYGLLVGLMLVLALVGIGCSPAATAVPTAASHTAFDLTTALNQYVTNLPDGFGTITAARLKDQLAAAKPFLLDVREASELTQNGYIATAVNVPIRTLFKNLDKLPQDKTAPIVVYCAIGHRGALAMATLQLLGYTNVKSLAGGFNAWMASGYAVEKASN